MSSTTTRQNSGQSNGRRPTRTPLRRARCSCRASFQKRSTSRRRENDQREGRRCGCGLGLGPWPLRLTHAGRDFTMLKTRSTISTPVSIIRSRHAIRSRSSRRYEPARGSRGRRVRRRGARVRPRRVGDGVDRSGVRRARVRPREGRPRVRAARPRRAAAPTRASLDEGRRLRRTALDPAADCSSGTARSNGASPSIPARPTFRRRSKDSPARHARIDLRPAYGRVPRAPGVHYFFSRPSTGARLQTAESLPALDGPPRRRRSRRLDVDPRRPAHRPARHPHDSHRPLPAADEARVTRLEDGRGHHGRAPQGRSR